MKFWIQRKWRSKRTMWFDERVRGGGWALDVWLDCFEGGFWDLRDGVRGYNEGLDLGMMPDKGN